MAELDDTGDNTHDSKSWYVDDADFYANSSQDLITASRALYNQRKQLHKVMNHCEDIFERFTGNREATQTAKTNVERELLKLTRCMTYWCYMLIARKDIINWDMESVSRFGIKPQMKYTDGRFLLNIDTIIEGHTYNWKADFQGNSLPLQLNNTDDVKQLLTEVNERIKGYYEKIESKITHKTIRQKLLPKYHQQPPINFSENNLRDTLQLLKRLMEDITQKMETNPESLKMHKHNGLHAQLGKRLHSDDSQNIHDEDGDVTYNTKKRIYFKYDSTILLDEEYKGLDTMDYKVEVMKHYPYRRNKGVHIDTENKNTIRWLNNVLPNVSKGWYEIVFTLHDQAYKIQLTPWERKNTTFVRPFALVSKQGPIHEDTRLVDIGASSFDFRDTNLHDFNILRLPPYLIHGKGNEIDAMVHSLRVIDHLDRRIQQKIDNDISWLAQQIKEDPETYGPLIQDQNIMQYMRAYFSSDAKSGVVGDRSVFFVNIQGVVVGVEMYAPSLPPFVDLQGKSGGFGTLPKNYRRNYRQEAPHTYVPQDTNGPHWMPPAPKAEVHLHPQTISPEILKFIEDASGKISTIEKYMQEHKDEMPKQIERAVKEATRDLHAVRGAIENQSQQPNAWANRPRFNPFNQSPSPAQQNVHAHEKPNPKDTSAMTYEERKVHDEKERQKKIREEAARQEREKAEKEKYRRSDQKEILNLPPSDLALIDGERINFRDFPSKVEGHFNEMYQLQLYPPYRDGVPNVDVSGLVPEAIRIEINIKDDDYEKSYNGVLQCLDSTVPVFGGKVRITPIKHGMTTQERDCYLIVTRHVLKNSSNINTDVVWGIKRKNLGDSSYIYENCELIAHKKPEAEPFLIGGAQRHNWNFTHSLDMDTLGRDAVVEVVVANSGTERYIRGANATIENVPERKKSEAHDEYQQMDIEDLKQKKLYGLLPSNLEKYNRRQELLKMNNRVNKIVLYTFSQDYMKKLISGNEDLKASVNIFSCPKFLRMTSWWLNENPNVDPSVSDPANSNMYLVDTQGPVYVSENGRFMVSPYIAKNGSVEVATWGIFIWNSNKAKYETFAYKLSGRQSLFLINDPDNCLNWKDLELGARAENYWVQFLRFDGSPIGEDEAQETQVISFFLTQYDTSRPSNPYHMFPRFPDYTISQAEHNILKWQSEQRGQTSTDNKFEEHTPFHEANMLALEAFTEHHLNTKNQNSNPGLGPVLPPGVTPKFTFKRNTPASTTMQPKKFPRKFYEPRDNLQTYRTYRLESGVLDYNPWEFALHRVLLHVNRFLHARKEELGDDEEFKKFLQEQEERLNETKDSRPPVAHSKVKKGEFRNANFRPNGGNTRFKAEYSDDADDYLLRQCFDDPPASQRLPAQPRKLAAPVRTFAPWKPPAAGVSW